MSQKKVFKIVTIFVIIGVILGIGGAWIMSEKVERYVEIDKEAVPGLKVPHWPIIKAVSEKYDIDPYFVSAVMWQESKFDTRAKSKVGAIGLMQLMPKTGIWIMREKLEVMGDRTTLYGAEVNIECGVWYLNWLLKKFNEDLTLALAGYNAGPSVARKWKSYPETRHFIAQVLNQYDKYKSLKP